MEKTNFIKLGISGVGAYLSAKLGILFPILMILLAFMAVDFITGIIKANYIGEVQSRRGVWGIVKKALYGVVVAVAIVSDWIILNVAELLGVVIPLTTFFGLLVSIWFIFNEFVSILENLIIMEVPIPGFLKSFVSGFKIVVEGQGNKIVDSIKGEQQ